MEVKTLPQKWRDGALELYTGMNPKNSIDAILATLIVNISTWLILRSHMAAHLPLGDPHFQYGFEGCDGGQRFNQDLPKDREGHGRAGQRRIRWPSDCGNCRDSQKRLASRCQVSIPEIGCPCSRALAVEQKPAAVGAVGHLQLRERSAAACMEAPTAQGHLRVITMRSSTGLPQGVD